MSTTCVRSPCDCRSPVRLVTQPCSAPAPSQPRLRWVIKIQSAALAAALRLEARSFTTAAGAFNPAEATAR